MTKKEKFDFSKEPGKIRKNQVINKGNEKKPRISIITPYYNARFFFEQTFNSVLNQTFQDFEWIIIDDGSDEENKLFLHQICKGNNQIRIITQENSGQAKARNVGIKNARADIIVTLDADDLIEEYYLEISYLALKNYPGAAWSYTDSVGFYEREYLWQIPFSAGRLTISNFLTSTAAFRKSALEKVGGYSELEKHYDEDWELFLKLLANKLIPVHISALGFWYRRHSSGMGTKVRNDEMLREKSYQHIEKVAREVPLNVSAYEYFVKGKPRYSSLDKVINSIVKVQCGRNILKNIVNK